MRIALTCVFVTLLAAGTNAQSVRIGVASNFKPTLLELNALYADAHGDELILSSASTGTLTSQILHGAPLDIFFAADKAGPDRIAQSIGGTPFCYARGRLVLLGPDAVADSSGNATLAIANPQTAPYGRAAMEVLQRPEFSTTDYRIVRGANAAQAYQFWHTGAAQFALVPAAFAMGQGKLIPQEWHGAVDQYAIVLRHSKAVERYVNWIRGDTVRAFIAEAGYEPCP